jgi:1,6-anhydro-N-acetylmuramate kinase
MYRTRIIKMLSRIAAALVALLVFGQSALAASNNRITHHGRAVRHAPPPAAFSLPDATPSHAVKPFTAEEKGWFDRASRVF